MNKRTKTILIYHVPAMLYAGLIITLSSLPNLQSPNLGILNSDKVIHFAEYAVFAFLFYRSFSQSFSVSSAQSSRLNSGSMAALMTFALLLLFSVGDELHQKFVPGRTADVFDVLADVLGGALVILLLQQRNKSLSRKRRSKSDD